MTIMSEDQLLSPNILRKDCISRLKETNTTLGKRAGKGIGQVRVHFRNLSYALFCSSFLGPPAWRLLLSVHLFPGFFPETKHGFPSTPLLLSSVSPLSPLSCGSHSAKFLLQSVTHSLLQFPRSSIASSLSPLSSTNRHQFILISFPSLFPKTIKQWFPTWDLGTLGGLRGYSKGSANPYLTLPSLPSPALLCACRSVQMEGRDILNNISPFLLHIWQGFK